MIRAGSIITCPVCKEYLYAVKHDIKSGEFVTADLFVPIGDSIPTPLAGEVCRCPKCHASLVRRLVLDPKKVESTTTGMQIFTDSGWS